MWRRYYWTHFQIRKLRLSKNKIACLKISVGNIWISQVPYCALFHHLWKVNMWHTCPLPATKAEVSIQWSQAWPQILHSAYLQPTGRSKHLKLYAIPGVNHAASHLTLVRCISRRAGLAFAIFVHICTSVHKQWTVFILFEKGSTSGWPRIR